MFDAFYVRSSLGWLSRPHTKKADRLLVWNESFAYAVPFPDIGSARGAMGVHGATGVSFVKSSNVFTEVVVDESGAGVADHVRSAIQSACAARDIVKELELAAGERMRAMKPDGAKEKGRAGARL